MLQKQKSWSSRMELQLICRPAQVKFLIIADRTANPEFIAADLLSQAEHGADSQVIMLTDNQELIEKVKMKLKNRLQ